MSNNGSVITVLSNQPINLFRAGICNEDTFSVVVYFIRSRVVHELVEKTEQELKGPWGLLR